MDEFQNLPYREQVLRKYDIAKRINPRLTEGEFMYKANPGFYSDEASAARAFRKLKSGEISGQRIRQRRGTILRRKETVESRRKRKALEKETGEKYAPFEYEEYVGKVPGGHQFGLWKKVLTIQYVDQDGNTRITQKSYIIHADDYIDNDDIPIIDAMTMDEDYSYLLYWSDEVYEWTDAEIIAHDVYKINRTSQPRERTVVLG